MIRRDTSDAEHRIAALPTSEPAHEKSTATAAQELRIVEALMSGPKTTDDLRSVGCYQVSARIWGLRARGYNIVTDLFNGYAADGLRHARMARYTLVELPMGDAP
ncbi:helix-turn-helix domain-containing protein [Variovorax boronicumulans]|uniref:helix-turn-helix domain-containing protein n=1 Tax=Variovorax boronicumulans TaxID=436515 RepID=UPI00358E0E3B